MIPHLPHPSPKLTADVGTKDMKRIATIAIVFATLTCSCVRLETKRVAVLNTQERTIYFNVSGFVTFPLTAEGPFPSWDNDLLVQLTTILPTTTGQTVLVAGPDFSTKYGEVNSGTVTIDHQRKTATISVQYTDDYWWNRVRGRFPIKEESQPSGGAYGSPAAGSPSAHP